jgi:methylenetetrahydrofolate reductase (NADPH)
MAVTAGFGSSSNGPTSVGSMPSTTLPHLGAIDGSSIRVSFEFFPPKTEAMEEQVWNAIRRLAPVAPTFFSVTYGAGGSTRDRTHRLVTEIQAETRIPAAAHLTCVDATTDEIDAVADAYWQAGIRHIVALRGDPSSGIGGTYRPTPGGYAYADSLVAGLRRLHPFDISVGAYPETHPSAASPEADIDALKRKIDAGANRAITQFFFDTEAFERFLERVVRAGITVPIVPGILPVTNVARTAEFAKSCGATIPDWVRRQFDGLDADPTTRQMVATLIAAEQCRTLYGLGIRDFHFYTLNRAELALGVCHALGVRAGTEASAQGNRSHG